MELRACGERCGCTRPELGLPRRRVRAGMALRPRVRGKGSQGHRAGAGGHARRNLLLPIRVGLGGAARQSAGGRGRVRLRLRRIPVRPLPPSLHLRGVQRGPGWAPRLRRHHAPCRRCGEGDFQPSLRPDHAPRQPSRGDAVSVGLLPLQFSPPGGSGHRSQRVDARPGARERPRPQDLLHADVDRVLVACRIAPAYRCRGYGRRRSSIPRYAST